MYLMYVIIDLKKKNFCLIAGITDLFPTST